MQSNESQNQTILLTMSLPLPPNSTRPSLSAREQEEWDAPFTALAQKSGGDLRLLLHSFFSFLNRKTDFYLVPNDADVVNGVNQCKMGFRNGDAEKMLLASFRQFPLRRMPPIKNQQKTEEGGTSTSTAQSAATKTATTKTVVVSSKPVETKQVPEKVKTNSKTQDEKPMPKKTPSEDANSPDSIRYTDKGKQIPVGNGGSSVHAGTESKFTYKWTQTIQELSLAIPIPEGTRAKDLNVDMKFNKIKAAYKSDSSKALIQGDLGGTIQTDESTWTLEGNVLLFVFEKREQTWWESVLKDCIEQERIDTNMVDSRRKISEYDASTQGMMRKIMFDQRQQRLGLPCSDEILIRDDLIKHGEDPDEYFETDKAKGIPKESFITPDNIPDLPPGVEFIDKTNFPPSNGQSK
jgi:hypothetical protein